VLFVQKLRLYEPTGKDRRDFDHVSLAPIVKPEKKFRNPAIVERW